MHVLNFSKSLSHFHLVGPKSLTAIALGSGMIGNTHAVVATLIAAFFANFVESYIGASFQTEKYSWLTNEVVNLINTAVGAVAAMSIYALLGLGVPAIGIGGSFRLASRL